MYMSRDAKDFQQIPEGQRAKEEFSLTGFRESMIQYTPDLRHLRLQNYETMYIYFKTLNL